ncbi:MAG: Spo0B domain-containing protein [Clostridia bacterium]|nr:Spo0B domain-containing protein [Clostridia bacterium]
MKRLTGQARIRKAASLVIVVNALQIAAMALVVILQFWVPDSIRMHPQALRLVALGAAAVVTVSACLNIRDALNTRRLYEDADGMSSALQNMAELNNTLRAQRHDFLNHLQVVYSLTEMGEHEEANRYIEKVYGQITAVSRAMKTAVPAVNALLQVKLAACEREGIPVELEIRSDWSALPIEGWEMCKVLSNLIDNAMDAVRENGEGSLRICLEEDLHALRFAVADTGAPIPDAIREHLFDAGVTGKADGHGMGLYIARRTLERAGGGIEARSDGDETVFSGWVPKNAVVSSDLSPADQPSATHPSTNA